MARGGALFFGIALVACRREPDRASIKPDAVDSATVTADAAAGRDAAPESETAAAWTFTDDDAFRAAEAISPATKAIAALKAPRGNFGDVIEPPPAGCVSTDPECAWNVGVGIHHPERFEAFDWCRVHVTTGAVHCLTSGAVGVAKHTVADAGTDIDTAEWRTHGTATAFAALEKIDFRPCGVKRTRAKVWFSADGSVSRVEFDNSPKPPPSVAECVVGRITTIKIPPFTRPTPPFWVGWPLPYPLTGEHENEDASP